MAKKQTQVEKNLEQANQALSRTEQFIENNQKNLLIGLTVIILLVVGGLGFYHGYVVPREQEAATLIFKGQNYFEQDDFEQALNGDGIDYIGFEEINAQYSLTKTGKLAAAYAGLCYYRLGDKENALKFLKKYTPGDNLVEPYLAGMIGDCYLDAGNVNEGISYFEAGAKQADNVLISPYLLKKAAIAYESQGKNDAALKCYTTIKEKYFQSVEALDIDKYIERIRLSESK